MLTRDELATLLCEVEATINSRPLTFVGEDSPQPLSPAHFLLNRRYLYQPTGQVPVNERHALLERDRLRLTLLGKFWDVWRHEYLKGLPASVSKFKTKGVLRVGDCQNIIQGNE